MGDLAEEPIDDATFDDWVALVDRALTFDGYAHVGGTTEAAWELALEVRSGWLDADTSGFSDRDLRAALLAECRRNHMAGAYPPSRRLFAYLVDLERLADCRHEAGATGRSVNGANVGDSATKAFLAAPPGQAHDFDAGESGRLVRRVEPRPAAQPVAR